MSVGAPRDPLFYVDLEAFGQRTGVRPEDALFIWASESGLDSTLSGESRTFSTLMHPFAVPRVMTEEVWQRLPTMTHREQLPYVEAAIFAPAHRLIGNRPFNSTFEVYLANAAPGLLRQDGTYSDDTPMYVGKNYPDNWTLDNYPAGNAAYQQWVATARAQGQKTTLRAGYSVAEDLISKGVLKGYVSLGDLKNFAKRMLSGGASVANDAVTFLNNVRANVAAGRTASIAASPGAAAMVASRGLFYAGRTSPTTAPSASSYTPDFESAFKPGAPIDTRIATPDAARAARPSGAVVHTTNLLTGDEGPPHLAIAALAGGVIAIGIAIALASKGSKKNGSGRRRVPRSTIIPPAPTGGSAR